MRLDLTRLGLEARAMTEDTIYDKQGVLVTSDRVIINGNNYAVRNISSVRRETTTPKIGCVIAISVVWGIIWLGATAGSGVGWFLAIAYRRRGVVGEDQKTILARRHDYECRSAQSIDFQGKETDRRDHGRDKRRDYKTWPNVRTTKWSEQLPTA